MDFEIEGLEENKFRCTLGGDIFFDFSVNQLELFTLDSFFTILKDCKGMDVFSLETGDSIGELVSVRYLKAEDEMWILLRNGIRGEIYCKNLGG